MMASYVLCCFLTGAGLVSPPLPGPIPATTTTKTGSPGDPVNLVLIGSREELVSAFGAAGWSVADPITVRSVLRIGVSVALNRSYLTAPVSDLYLFGRTQDVAFECAVGPSARTRHHVRFWQAPVSVDGRAVWVGSGTFDVRVGRSPATGRLTHRISPDVDNERDFIIATLGEAGGLLGVSRQAGNGAAMGRNGEGDCYFTDGAIVIGVLAERPILPVECETCRSSRRLRR